MLSVIPEYTKTFNFLVAMVVTLCVGAEWSDFCREGLRVICSRAKGYDKHLFTIPSSFNMSKNTKAQAVAAQSMVDDEPDDW